MPRTTIEVIYENKDLLVFYKPAGLPTVPLKNGEGDTLLSECALSYPEILSPWGRNSWEGSIIHRLDTPTSGLVLSPRNKEFYDYLSFLQSEDKILKTYRAEVSEMEEKMEGFESCPYSFSQDGYVKIISSFRAYGPKGASVRPLYKRRKGDERQYETEVRRVDENNVECVIKRGFRHQIRCHLSWLGLPIIGDQRYGGKENPMLMLEAVKVSFPSLDGKGDIVISID